MIVHGGMCGDMVMGDVWSLDLVAGAWRRERTRGKTPPRARAFHAAAMMPSRARMFIFGGRAGDGTLLNDLHYLDLTTMSWSQVRTGPGMPCPAPRESHTMVALRGDVLVMGGWGADPLSPWLNDVWNFRRPGPKAAPDRAWREVAFPGRAAGSTAGADAAIVPASTSSHALASAAATGGPLTLPLSSSSTAASGASHHHHHHHHHQSPGNSGGAHHPGSPRDGLGPVPGSTSHLSHLPGAGPRARRSQLHPWVFGHQCVIVDHEPTVAEACAVEITASPGAPSSGEVTVTIRARNRIGKPKRIGGDMFTGLVMGYVRERAGNTVHGGDSGDTGHAETAHTTGTAENGPTASDQQQSVDGNPDTATTMTTTSTSTATTAATATSTSTTVLTCERLLNAEDHGDGSYTTKFIPRCVGPHEIRVFLDGVAVTRRGPIRFEVTPGRVCAARCTITPSKTVLRPGDIASFRLTLRDATGCPTTRGSPFRRDGLHVVADRDALEFDLVTTTAGTAGEAAETSSLTGRAAAAPETVGRYTLTATALRTGDHRVVVRLKGRQVQGSPIMIHVVGEDGGAAPPPASSKNATAITTHTNRKKKRLGKKKKALASSDDDNDGGNGDASGGTRTRPPAARRGTKLARRRRRNKSGDAADRQQQQQQHGDHVDHQPQDPFVSGTGGVKGNRTSFNDDDHNDDTADDDNGAPAMLAFLDPPARATVGSDNDQDDDALSNDADQQ
jgi:hypothetical protein